MKKIFVIDTNVILHDYDCIFKFEDNDVVIPITVLEELDQFKKGDDLINYHAREFTRIIDGLIDDLSDDNFFKHGVSLGDDKGKLFVNTNIETTEIIKKSFSEDTPDHRILSVCNNLRKNKNNVILVTKDINLRIKAKSIGIPSENYKYSQITNTNCITELPLIITDIDSSIISQLHNNEEINKSQILDNNDIINNQYLILKNGSSSALATYKNENIKIVRKENVYNIVPRNAEQTFSINALLDDDIQLVALSGKAGTGKTLLALASAIHQRKKYHQIYLARPIVALSNKDLGYLPGDMKEKVDPYMQPLFDNLNVIKHQFNQQSRDFTRINEMLNKEKLVIQPLAYIRGRSLSNVFFIVDEAQNLTPHEVKTIITRAGEGTKIIFTGDINQIDSPYLDARSNGLSYLISKMKGQKMFAHINLIKGERSALAELASNVL